MVLYKWLGGVYDSQAGCFFVYTTLALLLAIPRRKLCGWKLEFEYEGHAYHDFGG